MWIIDYGPTWIKFYKVDKNKSFQFVSPPTSSLFFYLLEKVLKAEGYKKKETLMVGFPGVVKDGKVLSTTHLDARSWKNVQLENRLSKYKMRPYVINDTDLHGHMVIRGKGVELVLALGTSVGSSVYMDGVLVPNTELGHTLLTKAKTYEELLNYKAFVRHGRGAWLKNVKLAVEALTLTFNPDKVYLTGDMSPQLRTLRGPKHVRVVDAVVPSKKSIKALRYLED
jgi:polyphosphate glucokinase